MTQPGAPAALQGYRLQALYTLKRVYAEGLGGTRRFQPEGIEDLDVLDSDGTLVEAIQVKSYPNLTLSDLEPEKKNSFFHRAAHLLRGKNPPAIAGQLRRHWPGVVSGMAREQSPSRSRYEKTRGQRLRAGRD